MPGVISLGQFRGAHVRTIPWASSARHITGLFNSHLQRYLFSYSPPTFFPFLLSLSPRWISPGERATPLDGGCNSHLGCETTVLEHPRVSFRDLSILETSPEQACRVLMLSQLSAWHRLLTCITDRQVYLQQISCPSPKAESTQEGGRWWEGQSKQTR